MKNNKNVILIVAFSAVSAFSFGQATSTPSPSTPGSTPGSSTGTTQSTDPQSLQNQSMKTQLGSDLSGRNSQLGNNQVDWYSNGGNGYYGTYSVGDKNYMSTYNKQGKFQDTYSKGDWNDSGTPSSLKDSFGKSQYKDQNVTGFYQSSTNPNNYYFETQDQKGKTSRFYSDQSGKFSTNPGMSSSGSGASTPSTPKQ